MVSQSVYENLLKIFYDYVKINKNQKFFKIWVPSYVDNYDYLIVNLIIKEIKSKLDSIQSFQIFSTNKQRFNCNLYQFTKEDLSFLSDDKINQYFKLNEKIYSVDFNFWDDVLFSTLNLEKEAPISNIDLVFTSSEFLDYNLSIKRQIYKALTFSLKINGIILFTNKYFSDFIDLDYEKLEENIYKKNSYSLHKYNKKSVLYNQLNTEVSTNIKSELHKKDYEILKLTNHIKKLEYELKITTQNYNKKIVKLDFIQNAFNTIFNNLKTDILVLDFSLNIIQYTNNINKFFDVKNSKFLTKEHLSKNFLDIDFYDKVKTCIKLEQNLEFEIEFDSKIFWINIIMMNNPNNLLDIDSGVLISFTDRTEMDVKNKLIFQKSKLISMGEMMANIAHQWRQPLNLINLNIIKLQLYDEKNKQSNEFREDVYGEINELIEHLSTTIDEFSSFLKSNPQKREFRVTELFDEVLGIFSSTKNSDINIKFIYEQNLEIKSYKNILKHILLVFLNNSADAFNEKVTINKNIEIKFEIVGKKVELTYVDTAGGINNEIIEKVFDPYFTTKDKTQGTGIGLYMTKMLVFDILKGSINISNFNKGLKIKIVYEL